MDVGQRVLTVTASGGTAPYTFQPEADFLNSDPFGYFDVVATGGNTAKLIVKSPIPVGIHSPTVCVNDSAGNLSTFTLTNGVTVSAVDGLHRVKPKGGGESVGFDSIFVFDPAQQGYTDGQIVTSITCPVSGVTLTKAGTGNISYEAATKSLVFPGGAIGPYFEVSGGPLATGLNTTNGGQKKYYVLEVFRADTGAANTNEHWCWGTTSKNYEMLYCASADNNLRVLHGDDTNAGGNVAISAGVAAADGVFQAVEVMHSGKGHFGLLRDGGLQGGTWNTSGDNPGVAVSSIYYQTTANLFRWARRTFGAVSSSRKHARLLFVGIGDSGQIHMREKALAWVNADTPLSGFVPRERFNPADFPRTMWAADFNSQASLTFNAATNGKGVHFGLQGSQAGPAGGDIWGAGSRTFNVDKDYAPIAPYFTPVTFSNRRFALNGAIATPAIQAVIGLQATPPNAGWQTGTKYASVGGAANNRQGANGRINGAVVCRHQSAAETWGAIDWQSPADNGWPPEKDTKEGIPPNDCAIYTTGHQDENLDSGDDSSKPSVTGWTGDFCTALHTQVGVVTDTAFKVYHDSYLVCELSLVGLDSQTVPLYGIINWQIGRTGQWGGLRSWNLTGVTRGATTMFAIALGSPIKTPDIKIGDSVYIQSAAGFTALNDRRVDVTAVDPVGGTITVNYDSSADSNWTSGGTIGLSSRTHDPIIVADWRILAPALPAKPSLVGGTQTEVTNWLAARLSAPPAWLQSAINDFILECKLRPLSARLRPWAGSTVDFWKAKNGLSIYCQDIESGALFDFVRGVLRTKTSAPAFTPYRGYKFDGVDDLIDTGVQPIVNDTIGFGNGVTTTFPFTLANVPARSWQKLAARPQGITINAGSVTIFDKGDGNLGGGGVFGTGATATINYATGVGSVTFSVAPSNGNAVSVFYTLAPKLNMKFNNLTIGLATPPTKINAAMAGNPNFRLENRSAGVLRFYPGSSSVRSTDLQPVITNDPVIGSLYSANRWQRTLTLNRGSNMQAYTSQYVSSNEADWPSTAGNLMDGGAGGQFCDHEQYWSEVGSPRFEDEEIIHAGMVKTLIDAINANSGQALVV